VMDGIAATQAIREAEKSTGNRVPIIAMTAHAMKGDREQCLAAGMDDYVPKRIRRELLFKTLAKLVTRNEASELQPTEPPRNESEPEQTNEDHSQRTDVRDEAKDTEKRENDSLSIIAWERLHSTFGNDESMLADLFTAFQQESTVLKKEIFSALECSDFDSVKRASHTLKGAALAIGAQQLVSVMMDMEQAALESDSQSLNGPRNAFEDALRAVSELTQTFIREQKENASLS